MSKRGQNQSVGWLPARPTDLTLEHAKFVAEHEDLSSQLGFGPAPDHRDVNDEAEERVEKLEEHGARW